MHIHQGPDKGAKKTLVTLPISAFVSAFCVMPFPQRDAFLPDAYLIMALSEFLPSTSSFYTGLDLVYVRFELFLFIQFRVFNFVIDIYLKDLILS